MSKELIKAGIFFFGFSWINICLLIGISNKKNKFGADAVENYCNQIDDNYKQIKWTVIGIYGLIVSLTIGMLI